MENYTVLSDVDKLVKALTHLQQISELMQMSHVNDNDDNVDDVVEQEAVKYIDPLQKFLNQRIVEVVTNHVAKNGKM